VIAGEASLALHVEDGDQARRELEEAQRQLRFVPVGMLLALLIFARVPNA
jgi:hypothetical protein